MAILLPTLLAFLVAGSQFVTNPEDMEKQFVRAQKLMAGGDFVGARQAYERLLAVTDQALLRASQVRVTIDEQEVGLQEAARYQLANMARKRAQLWHKEAALADSSEADSLKGLATGRLRQAAKRFAALRDEEGFGLRETAAYMVVDCLYEAEDFGKVVDACRVLLTRFPESRYGLRARYTLGWAHFQLEEFGETVEVFRAYVAQDSGSIRADRARLQWGLALEKLERSEEALEVFTKLAEAHDPSGMDFEEQTQVALVGLREGQSRRSLAAKGWIKRGDVLKMLGRFEEALEAYRKVGEAFPEEQHIAEMAWVRQALLAQKAQGTDAALEVYRYATEKAERMGFRARMQAGLMSLLFEEERYQEALGAHRLFLEAYGGEANEAGVSVDEAEFRIAECMRYLGEVAQGDSARVLLEEAVQAYGGVLLHGESYLIPEALFWRGYVLQELGNVDSARVAYEQIYQAHPQTALGCRAVLQVARLEETRSDTLYAQILAQCGEEEKVRAFAALELGHRRRVEGKLGEARELLGTIGPELPQHMHAQMELIQIEVQEGKTSQARTRLEGWLESIEEEGLKAQVQAQLGLLYQKEGVHDQALTLLRAAVPHLEGEMRVSARFGIGWSLFHQEEYGEAWRVWRDALKGEKMGAESRHTFLRGLGLCARELGDEGGVEPLYEEMILDEETRVEGMLGLGQFFLDRGEGKKAAAQIRELVDAEDLEVALQARLLLGKASMTQEQFDEAREFLQRGLALEPGPEKAAEFHFELGSAALGLQEYSVAVDAFANALEQGRRRELRAAALYYLGHSLRADDQLEKAEKRFAELVAEYPDQRQAFLIWEMRYGEEDFFGALAWYERVFSDWPESLEIPEALYGGAWCRLEIKDEEGMRDFFLQLARDYPDHERAHQGLLHLGDFYYNGQNFVKASRLYEQVVERFPETQEAVQARQVLVYLNDVEADSLYRTGMDLFDIQEYERAIQILQQVIEAYPDTPSEAAARCNIGVAYQQMKEYRRAAMVYREAVQVLKEREEEWRALAFARENLDWIAQNILLTSLEDVLATP